VTQAARFRELLRHDGTIVGAYDCITARMIARARFECVAKAPTPKGFGGNSAPRSTSIQGR
jgi:2-methylisocitrate lyase-like PEP mutase family enzyme